MKGLSQGGDRTDSALHGCGSHHTCQYLLGRSLESLRVAGLLRASRRKDSRIVARMAATEDVPDSFCSLSLVTDQLDWGVSVLVTVMVDRRDGSDQVVTTHRCLGGAALPCQHPHVTGAGLALGSLPEVRVHTEIVSHAVLPPVVIGTKVREVFTGKEIFLFPPSK